MPFLSKQRIQVTLTTALLTGVALPSLADPVETPLFSSKDWKLVEMASPKKGTHLCIASTSSAMDGVPHHLELVVDRSSPIPFSVRIRPEILNDSVLGIQTRISVPKVQDDVFAKTYPGPNGQVTFINIPIHTENLLTHFKRGLRVDATVFEGQEKKPLVFSLRGSSATISELEKRCRGGRPLAESEFEKAFLPSSPTPVDVTRVKPSDTENLLALLKAGHLAFQEVGSIQLELQRLADQYTNELSELSRLNSSLDHLTQKRDRIDPTATRASRNADPARPIRDPGTPSRDFTKRIGTRNRQYSV